MGNGKQIALTISKEICCVWLWSRELGTMVEVQEGRSWLGNKEWSTMERWVGSLKIWVEEKNFLAGERDWESDNCLSEEILRRGFWHCEGTWILWSPRPNLQIPSMLDQNLSVQSSEVLGNSSYPKTSFKKIMQPSEFNTAFNGAIWEYFTISKE